MSPCTNISANDSRG